MTVVTQPTVESVEGLGKKRFLVAAAECGLLFDTEQHALYIQWTQFQWTSHVRAKWLKGAETIRAAFSPNAGFCVVSGNKTLCLYRGDLEFVSKIDLFEDHTCIAVSDHGIIAVGTKSGSVNLYGPDGAFAGSQKVSHEGPVTRCAFVRVQLYVSTPDRDVNIIVHP